MRNESLELQYINEFKESRVIIDQYLAKRLVGNGNVKNTIKLHIGSF